MSADRVASELLLEVGGAGPGREASAAQPPRARSAAVRWAESGLLALTGSASGPPVLPATRLPIAADGALLALEALAPTAAFVGIGGAELLAERAAIAGLSRRGRISPGGACRLLPARDGWLAVNLPRTDDARSLAAWLEDEKFAGLEVIDRAAWHDIANCIANRTADELAVRASWLGLAVASTQPPTARPRPWLRIASRGPAAKPPPLGAAPLVADLSSLWAGPLSGRLLLRAGAQVVKIESTRRPDGARFGPAEFFGLLNAGKSSVALDFTGAPGRAALARLIERADLVIEGSRARALEQLGVDAKGWVGGRPGRVWLSLTGYGREDPRVAFGDDAAAAAGLCWCVEPEAPLFVGDAIADPLAGLFGALAAWAFWSRGEGALLDVSLVGVVARAIGVRTPLRLSDATPVMAPRAGSAGALARQLGADNEEFLER